jgi:hypothetical protein
MIGPDTATAAVSAGAIIVTVVFGSLIAITALILQYRSRKLVKNADLAAIEGRLARIEEAVDAIAVESERIGEALRFTTKLLGERSQARSPEP